MLTHVLGRQCFPDVKQVLQRILCGHEIIGFAYRLLLNLVKMEAYAFMQADSK